MILQNRLVALTLKKTNKMGCLFRGFLENSTWSPRILFPSGKTFYSQSSETFTYYLVLRCCCVLAKESVHWHSEQAHAVRQARSPREFSISQRPTQAPRPARGAAEDAARLDAERLEAERLEAERLEAERLEAERLEAERLAADTAERARLEAERWDSERLEAERLAADQAAAAEEAARAEAAGSDLVPLCTQHHMNSAQRCCICTLSSTSCDAISSALAASGDQPQA